MAAYMLDRYMIFTNSSNKGTVAGGLESISATDLLDNVMLYWITDSMTTSLRLYKESFVNYETEQILGS
ncbi:unnamed protein product [Parnassius apollo]|uniref:(apollo) hypothetical protein n=1 Tax=Parnassius apollo TaxID=110799 RepID=A0A8S3XM01_PARAO|nr:unnamed protein product [Parnassius apollo]